MMKDKGLYSKYNVTKRDTGETVENCFVLKPDKDPVAAEALRVYARLTNDKVLAQDIKAWVGSSDGDCRLTAENIAQEYLNTCDTDLCYGDDSVGIAPCPFYDSFDVDDDGHFDPGGCVLRRFLKGEIK